MNKRMTRKTALGLMAGASLATLAGCGGGSGGGSGSGGGGGSATASSKEFTEQVLLGQMYGLALANAGFDVDYQLSLGSEQVMDRSLIDGSISVYPEYTGTAFVAILERPPEEAPDTPEETYNIVSKWYRNREDTPMRMLPTAPFNNNYGIVMRASQAEELGITTLDDLARESGGLTFSSYSEFQNRSDGYANMQENYPELDFGEIRVVNSLGIRYQALAEEEADVAIGFTTDGQLASDELRVIEDPQVIWPFYYPGPVLTQEFLDNNPDAEGALNAVSESLDSDIMRQLNGAVDLDQEDPEDVAQGHLEDAGVL